MRLLPRNLFLASLFHIPLHPAMLQKIAMTRRFICHHGMLQPLRWLDVTSTVAVGQRCRLSTEKCNKFTVPQLTHGRSSHLEGHLTQQPWMKTWYFCQVRRFGEDVCAPRVAAQPGNGSVFVDSSVWQVRHTDEDLSDETRDVVRNELGDSTSNDQNGKSWDNQPVRGRLGRVVKWRNLLTSEEGTWPSIAAAARELGVSPRTVARRCRECNESSQIGDYKVELALRAGKPEQEQKRVEKIQKTVKHAWMVSNYGRIRNTRGEVHYGSLMKAGYRRATLFGRLFSVHRVVALTFIGPPPDPLAWQVHHKDGDPSNNKLKNLKYTTCSQNIKSTYCNPSRGNAGLALSKPVMWKTASQEGCFESMLVAARELGEPYEKVVRSCRKGTQIGDYHLTFAPPKEPELLEGEKWLPMIDPGTGLEVQGRQVSSFGRIKSAKGLITRGHQTKSSYVMATIGPRRFEKRVSVHRVVAHAFLGPPPNPECSEVNHKDLDPSNNSVYNLEYVTPSQNIKHFHANRGVVPVGRSKAVQCRPHGSEDNWVHYGSLIEASLDLGAGYYTISKCCKGLIKQVRGYECRFARSEEPADLPGEEWRPVDFEVLQRDKAERKGRRNKGPMMPNPQHEMPCESFWHVRHGGRQWFLTRGCPYMSLFLRNVSREQSTKEKCDSWSLFGLWPINLFVGRPRFDWHA